MVRKVMGMVLLWSAAVLVTGCTPNATSAEGEANTEQSEVEASNGERVEVEKIEEEILTKEKAVLVLEDFKKAFNTIIQSQNEIGVLTKFQSLEELKQHLEHYMSSSLADQYGKEHFREREEGLFVEVDRMPLLPNENEVTFEEVGEQIYYLKQERTNSTAQRILITYTITTEDGIWIVDAIDTKELPVEEGQAGANEQVQDPEEKETNQQQVPQTESEEEQQNGKQKAKEESLKGKPLVAELEDRLRQLYKIKADETNKVVNYNTRSEILKDFNKVLVSSLATKYVDESFETKDGELYSLPGHLPIRVYPSIPFTLDKVTSSSYKLTQKNTTDMDGEYTITVTYQFVDGTWKIANRQIDYA
ncbi:hypothetical protein ACFFGV_00595 [Pontibacillus salicampi]|uniref:Uncharacterized protein n=1 Tax=Pontibacillus salicampi TaxID=1449801 RepID=A0ABV6LI71_9BACI